MKQTRTSLSIVALVAAGVIFATPLPAEASNPSWQPKASERLVKLPNAYLKKALDRDFRDSALGQAMDDTTESISLKQGTLEDLKGAIDDADGELQTELRHQLLAEKKAYIDLMGERQDLKRQQLQTQMKLYEKLLRKANLKSHGQDGPTTRLVEKQNEARTRFEQSADQVDMKLFGSTMDPESRYSRVYAKNLSAMESLVSAINNHPANNRPALSGDEMSREDYLRQLVVETQAELALVDQQGTMLGYMAKLVALDAQALADEVAMGDFAGLDEDASLEETSPVAEAVDFFLP